MSTIHTTPRDTWAVIGLGCGFPLEGEEPCPECLEHAEQAVTYATAAGSREGIANTWNHSATVHRIVAVVSNGAALGDVIHTVGDLDALPVDARVRDSGGDEWLKEYNGMWTCLGISGALAMSSAHKVTTWGPLTVSSLGV